MNEQDKTKDFSDLLNGAVEGVIVAIFFGGLFVLILTLIARFRRDQGRSVSMQPIWSRMAIGAVACVVLQAAGFQAYGIAALVLAAIYAYESCKD